MKSIVIHTEKKEVSRVTCRKNVLQRALPEALSAYKEAFVFTDETVRALYGKKVRAALGADGLAASHADWAADVYARRADELDGGRCEEVLRDEVGRVFAGVLEDAGVFKWDDEGRAAQRRFAEALG